jgi:hypothetical protein
MSLAITTAYVVALLLYATWFGVAIYMFLAPCYSQLSGPAFIEWFQKIDPYMKVRARQLIVAQLVLTLLILGLMHDRWATLGFWLTVVALNQTTEYSYTLQSTSSGLSF